MAGNGGSAADAEHIVGELMKGFKLPRKPETDFAEKLVAENQELGSVLAENLQGRFRLLRWMVILLCPQLT